MTGFRLAKGGVQELEGIKPDLTALGKIIGGGLPVGAFGGRRDVMEKLAPLGPVYQAGTLSGNPLAVAAGLAALTLIKETPPYPKLDEAGKKIAAALREAAARQGVPLQVPQVGSMFALFFTDKPVRDYAGALASDAAKFKKFSTTRSPTACTCRPRRMRPASSARRTMPRRSTGRLQC